MDNSSGDPDLWQSRYSSLMQSYSKALQEKMDLQIRNTELEAQNHQQKHVLARLEAKLNAAAHLSSIPNTPETAQLATLKRGLELMEAAMPKEGLLFPMKRSRSATSLLDEDDDPTLKASQFPQVRLAEVASSSSSSSTGIPAASGSTSSSSSTATITTRAAHGRCDDSRPTKVPKTENQQKDKGDDGKGKAGPASFQSKRK